MTPYENVTDRFIRKIKQDKEYFCINGVTEEEFEELITYKGIPITVNPILPFGFFLVK